MAEQFGLHQAGRQGAAVDRDEGAAAPRRHFVQGARGQLLAGTGLAGHQHRQFDRRELVQVRMHGEHRRARADQAVDAIAHAGPSVAVDDLGKALDLHQVQRLAQLQQAAPGRHVGIAQYHQRQVRVRREQVEHRRRPGLVGVAEVEQSGDPVATPQADPCSARLLDDADIPAGSGEDIALLCRRAPQPDHATRSDLGNCRHSSLLLVPSRRTGRLRDGHPCGRPSAQPAYAS